MTDSESEYTDKGECVREGERKREIKELKR